MREKVLLSQWQFAAMPEEGPWDDVTLPHTWNALDGQAGKGDYRRIRAAYRTSFQRPEKQTVYIRFEGANNRVELYCNERLVGTHVGGYAAFQFDLTPYLKGGENRLLAYVSNEKDALSYPLTADYTFFGGIYRQAALICFDGPHFSMARHGSWGVFVTPEENGAVHVKAYTEGGERITAVIHDPAGREVASRQTPVREACTSFAMTVPSPVLWKGRKKAACYHLHIRLDQSDAMDIPFGFRKIEISATDGFILNHQRYALHGVSRHQDRENMGWAIGPKEHDEDLQLICDIGATTVRLPHYQQDEYVLDRCDALGLVVWAETPLNSEYIPADEADALALEQLTEMICQQYNHPSICFWSLANEISIGGVSERLYALLRRMERTVKKLDPDRITVMANIGTTAADSPLWTITDAVTVNQYLGWYEGSCERYGPFLDALHENLPGRCLGLSEYGAEAVLKWHSDHPKCMDYTEEYQAYVHECAWNAIEQRPWLLGSWVWNMFDFAANHRDEGGVKGRNHKGLVTYDRKVCKDAFWFYKACWSDEPFVYLTGKRYTRRSGDTVTVKVYSNQPSVTLSNGQESWTQTGRHVFLFEQVPFAGEAMTLTARAGSCGDELSLIHLREPDPAYVLPAETVEVDARVRQWFAGMKRPDQVIHRAGYFTMETLMSEIAGSEEALSAVEKYWAAPIALQTPDMAERLRKGGSMRPAQIWRYIRKYLPEEAYVLLEAALAKIPCEAKKETTC